MRVLILVLPNKEFGAFSFYTPKYPNQFEITQTTFASLQTKKRRQHFIQ